MSLTRNINRDFRSSSLVKMPTRSEVFRGMALAQSRGRVFPAGSGEGVFAGFANTAASGGMVEVEQFGMVRLRVAGAAINSEGEIVYANSDNEFSLRPVELGVRMGHITAVLREAPGRGANALVRFGVLAKKRPNV